MRVIITGSSVSTWSASPARPCTVERKTVFIAVSPAAPGLQGPGVAKARRGPNGRVSECTERLGLRRHSPRGSVFHTRPPRTALEATRPEARCGRRRALPEGPVRSGFGRCRPPSASLARSGIGLCLPAHLTFPRASCALFRRTPVTRFWPRPSAGQPHPHLASYACEDPISK